MSKKIELQKDGEGTYLYMTKDGLYFRIKEAEAQHLTDAQEKADGASNEIIYWLMSALCTLDGKQLFMEDLKKMRLKLFVELSAAFNEVNF